MLHCWFGLFWRQEPPVERWAVNYMDNSSEALDIAVDKLGNVYVTGYCRGSGFGGSAGDYATIKYDSNGNQLWAATYNGPGNSSDGAVALAIDSAGNVYVTGSSYGSGTDYDYATIKYDSNGNQKWAARYNGAGNGYDNAVDVAVDGYGNVYVTGYSGADSDYATIKYDPNGNQKWIVFYNGLEIIGTAHAVVLDNFGNVYVTGGSSDVVQNGLDVKYDSNGNQKWVASGGSSEVAIDDSGNVYVAGSSATVKYDSNGNQKWIASGGVNDVAVDNSGNVYVAGNQRRRLCDS